MVGIRKSTSVQVHKRGAVRRSIDITRYSGYDELKQDTARRFGVKGQLEHRGRIGWKLVYEDNKNDVLPIGGACLLCLMHQDPIPSGTPVTYQFEEGKKVKRWSFCSKKAVSLQFWLNFMLDKNRYIIDAEEKEPVAL